MGKVPRDKCSASAVEYRRNRLLETEQTLVKTKSGEVHNGTLKYHITPIAPIKKAYDEKELDKLRREAEMRERIAKYERHTGNSVHAENHAENGQM